MKAALYITLVLNWNGSAELKVSTPFEQDGVTIEPCVVSYDMDEVSIETRIEASILKGNL